MELQYFYRIKLNAHSQEPSVLRYMGCQGIRGSDISTFHRKALTIHYHPVKEDINFPIALKLKFDIEITVVPMTPVL